MAVIYYQLAILATLIFVRVAFPKRLLIVALIWSGLTVINLFYPPLIIIQLAVIWGGYAVLKSRPTSVAPAMASSPGATQEAQVESVARKNEPAPVIAPIGMQGLPLGAEPSWANTERFSQFKAGVMMEAMDRYSVPFTYAVELMGNSDLVKRLMVIAADQERGGRSFEEQELAGAKFLMETWRELSETEQGTLQADHDRLEQIKF